MSASRLRPSPDTRGAQAGGGDQPLPTHVDHRGTLLPIDLSTVPFSPRRIFVVSDVPAGVVRGSHRTLDCRQLLICIRPRIELILGVGSGERRVTLDSVGARHLLPPGEFIRYRHSRPDATLLVLADQAYEPSAQETIPVPAG